MAITSVANARNLSDAALSAIIALPAAGATAVTAGIDLGQTTGGTIEGVEVVVQVPATATLVNAKALTITLKDSADNSSFTAITGLSTGTITGTAGNVSAAFERRVRLPAAARRYIRAEIAAPADGGDNTATSMTLSVLV